MNKTLHARDDGLPPGGRRWSGHGSRPIAADHPCPAIRCLSRLNGSSERHGTAMRCGHGISSTLVVADGNEDSHRAARGVATGADSTCLAEE